VQRLVPYADCSGALILGFLPQGPTWDYLLGGYGPDVRFIDRALARTFRRFAIDSRRVGVKGFSNGATYALALGITNGDLFSHVVAHSPGSLGVENPNGSPSFFITHGTEDRTLPIDGTSRQIVPELRERGYEVTYREFSGGHDIPRGLEADGLSWLGCRG
jgi:phospholipase/carboxylesterase